MSAAATYRPPYLSVRGLCVSHSARAAWTRKRNRVVHAASFDVSPGECFALVGESGSGKSSTVQALLGLAHIDQGQVRVAPGREDGGFVLPGLARHRRRAFRREVQAIFQDPYLSLNPRLSIGTLIEEPLRIHGIARSRRKAIIDEVLDKVRLPASYLAMRPSQLSGGLRQRACIARALVLQPRLLVADEPVSALDLSVQGRIIDLLVELKQRDGLTILFVSHDMELVRFIADRVAVMLRGHIVEMGPPDELFRQPRHPYTQALLACVPSRLDLNLPAVQAAGSNEASDVTRATSLEAGASLARDVPVGIATSPASAVDSARLGGGPGCPYQSLCPMVDMHCRWHRPPLIPVGDVHEAACFKVT